MIHDISPGFVLLTYASPFGTHKQTIPIANPALVLGDWYVDEKASAAVLWTTAVDAFLDAIDPLVGSDVAYSAAELYTKAVGDAPILVATTTLSHAGTNGSTAVEACEMSIALKSTGGGKGKIVILDAPAPPNNRYVPPTYSGDSAIATFATYLTGSTDLVFMRDGNWPNLTGKALTKTNDTLRRKYNLT